MIFVHQQGELESKVIDQLPTGKEQKWSRPLTEGAILPFAVVLLRYVPKLVESALLVHLLMTIISFSPAIFIRSGATVAVVSKDSGSLVRVATHDQFHPPNYRLQADALIDAGQVGDSSS
jgi:hypothetical protein